MDTLTQVVFPAMGNTVNLTVIGDHKLVDVAKRRIAEIESRWSRFIRTSDVSRLNRAQGRPTPVHADTVRLVSFLVAAQSLTAGAFDPTIAPVLNDLGYFASRTSTADTSVLAPHSYPGCDLSTTVIDARFDALTLPAGATLDPGGLGKGLAADMVSTELISLGAHGVCLSVGGDVRCSGVGPIDGSWIIDVAHPRRGSDSVGRIRLGDGAVATSSVHAKQWIHDTASVHHVIDPVHRAPLHIDEGSIVQSTVIAAEAVWAEVFATWVLVDQGFPHETTLAGMVVRADDRVETNDRWKDFADE